MKAPATPRARLSLYRTASAAALAIVCLGLASVGLLARALGSGQGARWLLRPSSTATPRLPKAEPSAQVPARLRPLRPEPVDAASATPAALALGGTCAPPERVNGSAMVHAAEAGYRRCCERKWSSRLADGASARSLCSAVSGVAAPSTLRCHPVPGSIPGPDGAFPIWFCEATRVALNLGGNGGDLLRRFNYSRPTVSNANVYPPGALQLRGCALSSAFSTLDFGSKGLSRILPRAVGVSELPPPSQLSDENLVGGRLRSRVLTVLVVRMSPKNFYHGHFDFMVGLHCG
ncbi:hypothetical protein T492DRAFT_301476 [Pavlovales sp. CCMP2436]|nr:hypothetical protein T492DRAFT_301476 [Pavlovales sp. CCMP2436]